MAAMAEAITAGADMMLHPVIPLAQAMAAEVVATAAAEAIDCGRS
jgi:hypothetical protein